ncbi:MAG: BsaWI family type II restriction enzyme, partial [Microcystaceae cyanobacterium]
LPDADLIIYRWRNNTPTILCVLSVKNSFRERYTQTPYWKIKLSQSEVTQHIKVYMITPDNDNEISGNNPPRISRKVMEYELDGIYLAKEEFTGSDKVKSIQSLINDLERLL